MGVPYNVFAEFYVAILVLLLGVTSASHICELTAVRGDKVYRFNLAASIQGHPHGVLSEDGFYKVSINDTWLWFQLCDQMIFNHDMPKCFKCENDCIQVVKKLYSGLRRTTIIYLRIAEDHFIVGVISVNNEGYRVCNAIGQASHSHIVLIDEKKPQLGVMLKMSSQSAAMNCSLSVSVFCDTLDDLVPTSFNHLGSCNYATEIRHPAACADVISIPGQGWGWFSNLITTIIFLLLGYLLAGAVYRYLFLGIRGIEVVPNLEFWLSMLQRTQVFFNSLMRKFQGRAQVGHGSYAQID